MYLSLIPPCMVFIRSNEDIPFVNENSTPSSTVRALSREINLRTKILRKTLTRPVCCYNILIYSPGYTALNSIHRLNPVFQSFGYHRPVDCLQKRIVTYIYDTSKLNIVFARFDKIFPKLILSIPYLLDVRHKVPILCSC